MDTNVEVEPEDRFGFAGSWREFAPIALTNAILTLLTLGVYRFWALRRERHYLWSRTWFLDEYLEWTGSGRELFTGFLFGAFLVGIPVAAMQFVGRTLFELDYRIAASIAGVATLLFLNFAIGVARFRALRYRLSRTLWKGIRGGTDEPGWRYGGSNMWKWGANYVSLGSAIAWTMTSLWNDRWNKMSFGSLAFGSTARVRPIVIPFIFLYLIPLMLMVISATALIVDGASIGNVYIYMDAPPLFRIIFLILVALTLYMLISIIFVIYYAAFFRNGIAHLSLGSLRFSFDAVGGQWFMLFLVDGLIIIATLGLGFFFLGYRHWVFFAKHLAVYGELDDASLLQTTTQRDKVGDGWLDALDIGAF